MTGEKLVVAVLYIQIHSREALVRYGNADLSLLRGLVKSGADRGRDQVDYPVETVGFIFDWNGQHRSKHFNKDIRGAFLDTQRPEAHEWLRDSFL